MNINEIQFDFIGFTSTIRFFTKGGEVFNTLPSFSFGFSRLAVATADNLHFYNMAFLFLRSDALPATNPLFRGKTGPPVFHIKMGASR